MYKHLAQNIIADKYFHIFNSVAVNIILINSLNNCIIISEMLITSNCCLMLFTRGFTALSKRVRVTDTQSSSLQEKSPGSRIVLCRAAGQDCKRGRTSSPSPTCQVTCPDTGLHLPGGRASFSNSYTGIVCARRDSEKSSTS